MVGIPLQYFQRTVAERRPFERVLCDHADGAGTLVAQEGGEQALICLMQDDKDRSPLRDLAAVWHEVAALPFRR